MHQPEMGGSYPTGGRNVGVATANAPPARPQTRHAFGETGIGVECVGEHRVAGIGVRPLKAGQDLPQHVADGGILGKRPEQRIDLGLEKRGWRRTAIEFDLDLDLVLRGALVRVGEDVGPMERFIDRLGIIGDLRRLRDQRRQLRVGAQRHRDERRAKIG